MNFQMRFFRAAFGFALTVSAFALLLLPAPQRKVTTNSPSRRSREEGFDQGRNLR